MTERDLRIGNLIEFLGEVREVEAIDNLPKRPDMYWIKTKGMISHKIFQYKPIPLTEEWLVKFGFIYNGWNWDFESFRFHAQGRNEEGEFFNTEFGIRKNKEVFNISFNINYVHQLQNIYFILTNRELKLKEDE